MSGKVAPGHLARRAMVYVRQSSMAQVLENTESTTRQYALVQRAQSLGWVAEDVEVVDEDLGRSGASVEGRTGFARLAEEVSRGRVGAVLALEVSRLARSSADWQQLMRLCAIADVLVVDEHSVFDPSKPDDRLLLDLKGTMSEAELHWLGLRLVGARRSRARRGELRLPAPTGYVWQDGGFVKDPDEAVRRALEVVFERFEVEPAAWAVVRWAKRNGFQIPTRRHRAGGHSEVTWGPLGISRLWWILHNPVYAGAYVYGRRQTREMLVGGRIRRVRLPEGEPSEWPVRILDAHAGYVSWEAYEANRAKLRANDMRSGMQSAPREGRSLLKGLLVCGRCGRRMQPMYTRSADRWRYQCHGDRAHGGLVCWSLEGRVIDEAVEESFLEAMAPAELELALAVDQEASRRADSLGAQWRARIERAEYGARLAERRYKAVDPDNRVVARTLERDWEVALREVERVREDYACVQRTEKVELTEADRARVRALAADLPAVWRAGTTRPADRQAMLRLVVEAVTLEPLDVPSRSTRIQIAWRGGEVTERVVARPGQGDRQRTSSDALERLGVLVAEGEHDEVVTAQLNAEGLYPAPGRPWTVSAVGQARRRYGIARTAPDRPRRSPLPDRLPDGRYSVRGLARRAGVSQQVVRGWIARSQVRAAQEDFDVHRHVWWIEASDDDLRRLAELPSHRTPRKPRLPDRHPDGRYSIPGLARRLEVSRSTVGSWLRQGVIEAEHEAFGPYPRARWVRLDEQTEAQLRERVRRAATPGRRQT